MEQRIYSKRLFVQTIPYVLFIRILGSWCYSLFVIHSKVYSNLISSILLLHTSRIFIHSVFRHLKIIMTDTEGSSGSTQTAELASAEELNKRKIIAQSSFTRTSNSLCKLLDSGSPSAALNKTIEELEAKYKVLEERCEAISMSSEPDPKVEDLLTDKYDMLNDIRSRVMRTKPKTSDSTHTDGHEKTEELIKSFKVSLTMPKPETKKFDGDPSTFAEYMSYVETYVEPNVSDAKQCLALLVDTCTGKARDSIAYLLQCSNALEAYHAAKDVLREMFGRKKPDCASCNG